MYIQYYPSAVQVFANIGGKKKQRFTYKLIDLNSATYEYRSPSGLFSKFLLSEVLLHVCWSQQVNSGLDT